MSDTKNINKQSKQSKTKRPSGRVDELLDALAPFAKAFENVEGCNTNTCPENLEMYDRNLITPTVRMGDFRKAFEIYKKCI